MWLSKKNIALALVWAMTLNGAPLFAAETLEQGYNPEFNSRPPVPGEAAKSIMDRVFGVQGDAASIDYHVFELSQRKPAHAAIRSALVPGWGQAFNDQKTKGVLFFSVFTFAIVGGISQYHESRDSWDDYKASGIKNGDAYDDYETQQSRAAVLGTAAVLMWGISIFDAYRNAYTSLYSTEGPVQLALNPDGKNLEAQVTWRRKF